MAALEASLGDDNLPPMKILLGTALRNRITPQRLGFLPDPLLSDPIRACKCPRLASSKEGSRGQESRRRGRIVQQEEERFR